MNGVSLKILMRVSNCFQSEIEGGFDKCCLVISTVAITATSSTFYSTYCYVLVWSIPYCTEVLSTERLLVFTRFTPHQQLLPPPTSHIPSSSRQHLRASSPFFGRGGDDITFHNYILVQYSIQNVANYYECAYSVIKLLEQVVSLD